MSKAQGNFDFSVHDPFKAMCMNLLHLILWPLPFTLLIYEHVDLMHGLLKSIYYVNNYTKQSST